MRFLFPKDRRVLRSAQFTRVLRQGTSAADGTLVLSAIAVEDPQSCRLGVTIPKKTGNAVTRNKWKRLIREAFRTQSNSIPSGFDYVVRPKKGAEPVWREIQQSLPRLARKAVNRAAAR